MTISTYVFCFLAGLIGILIHLFAVKIPAVKAQAKVANTLFSYREYFMDDMAAVLSSILTVIAFLIVLDELVAFKPVVLPYLKAGFILIGFTGSSLLIALLGKATAKINQIVDIKTNIADNK